MRTRRHQSNRLEWIVMFAMLLLSLGCIKCCHGQQPPVPAYPQPPMQQAPAYAVPARGPLPWIRWHIFGRPTFDLYVPIGQPYPATVQPVVPYGGQR